MLLLFCNSYIICFERPDTKQFITPILSHPSSTDINRIELVPLWNVKVNQMFYSNFSPLVLHLYKFFLSQCQKPAGSRSILDT